MLELNYITKPDGSILFRGCPPNEVENYYQDPENKFRFIPAFDEECKHRQKCPYTKPCGKFAVNYFCGLKKQIVTVPYCNDCDVQDK